MTTEELIERLTILYQFIESEFINDSLQLLDDIIDELEDDL